MSTVTVSAERPYSVEIAHGAAAGLAQSLRGASKVAVIHPPVLADQAARLVAGIEQQVFFLPVPDGEHAKNVDTLAHCWAQLAQASFTRNDVIVGFGGGATTDLAGFVAASFLRGIGYVSVPTTVLAMVDAAVGGKTGIDLAEGKNLVGAFWEPRAVLADLDFLDTLPEREIRSGLGEVVKAGFVRDGRILELIREDPVDAVDPRSSRLAELIGRGIQFKADVVSADLRERTSTSGSIGRELLNYGHTLAHAIERHENFALRHGEAVAIGMVFAAELSYRLAGLSAIDLAVHRQAISSLGLPTSYSGADFETVRELMGRDKKTRGTTLRFVGLSALGQPTLIEGPSDDVLRDCFAAIAR